MTNLSNHFLIAMPQMGDTMFDGSVVYLCEHSQNGAMGIIVNKPSPIPMDVVFAATGQTMPAHLQSSNIMMGGPVQTERGFIIHTPVGEWQSSVKIDDDTALTVSRDILERLAEHNQVNDFILAVGHAGWSAGQLERELSKNAWLTVAADHAILFHTAPEKRYQAALEKLGIRPENLMKGGYA